MSILQIRKSRLNDGWHGSFVDSHMIPDAFPKDTKQIFDDTEETSLPKPVTWIDIMPDPPSIPLKD